MARRRLSSSFGVVQRRSVWPVARLSWELTGVASRAGCLGDAWLSLTPGSPRLGQERVGSPQSSACRRAAAARRGAQRDVVSRHVVGSGMEEAGRRWNVEEVAWHRPVQIGLGATRSLAGQGRDSLG
jgi:hypothetical protein